MASSFQMGKHSVDLAASRVPGSRIRRNPPPVVQEVAPVDLEQRDARTVIIGVITFALALFVITIALSSVGSWSPSEQTVHLQL